MALTFQPVTLDGNYGDEAAMLVFREGHLVAVISQLSAAHGVLEGQWFVEKTFGELEERPDRTFVDMPAVEAWVAAEGRS
ncbi:MAG TPA: hypothetical protein VGD66_07825 [Allosphingosinicella sp.]|jgi:hypothetical protein